MSKRVYDVMFSVFGLLLLWPLFIVIAAAIKLLDNGPVFFRQNRVGFQGQPFRILKFRTMVPNAQQLGASVTGAQDPRVTTVGRFLRKTKLDELPQLWNVLTGDMSFVGPRPEVPCYVARYSEEQRRVLCLKPGITDLATLLYRNEEEILGGTSNSELFYIEQIMPRKIDLNLAYAQQASRWQDTKIIVRTLLRGVPLKTRPQKANG